MRYIDLQINASKEKMMYEISKVHNEIPKLWMPIEPVTEAEIQSSMSRMMTNKCYIRMVQEDDSDTLVGFIWAELFDDHAMVVSLYVDKKHRHQGIASQLKKDLETWCINQEVYKIKTTVSYANKNMLKLNKELGYKAGMVHMVKELKPINKE